MYMLVRFVYLKNQNSVINEKGSISKFFQIKQREILERNENLKRWKEEFKVIQAQEKDAQSRIESVKESQRDLVRKIRDIIDSNPQIVNKIVDNVDSEFKEKLSLLNTVEKVSSKEEDLIRQIYKKK